MISWSVSPYIVRFGSVEIRWYTVFFIAAFIIGYKLMKRACRTEGKNFAKLDRLLYYIIAGVLIGARLGHCLFYEPEYFLKHPLEILYVWQGGLASHGGAVGMLLAIWIFAVKTPEFSFLWITDRLAIPVAIAAAMIRLGNLMNSEILGSPSDLPWAFVFKRIDQIPRHPAQIYEAIVYAIIAVVLWRVSKRNPSRGLLTGLLFVTIFLARIFLEFFKANQVSFESQMMFNMGQILSLPMIMIGLWLILQSREIRVTA